jgi:hypothetical protein
MDKQQQIQNMPEQNERILKEIIKSNDKTIEELKKEMNYLKQDNENLKKRLDKKDNNEIYKKYVIAILDIDSMVFLEYKLNSPSRDNLRKLKRNRFSECHYIYDDFTINEKNDRRTYLSEKFKNMPIDIKNKFDNLYPKLLEDIEPYISFDMGLGEKAINEINEWWEF